MYLYFSDPPIKAETTLLYEYKRFSSLKITFLDIEFIRASRISSLKHFFI